jgi:outer membrane protein insertion porin family
MIYSIAKNTIDDVLNPTKGVNTAISLETAGGPFGGDNYFVSLSAFYGRYIPIKFMDSSFFLKGTAGMIRGYSGRDVPITEKYYVGGLNSIRGFRYGEAGPMDENDEPIGAKNEMYFNFEWIFPIYKPAGVKGVIFTDTGAGFDDFSSLRMRTAAGVGIRWFSPLGPIRLELGFNLNPKEGERKSLFDFAIGTQY